MAIQSTLSQLEEVQAAITRVLRAQEAGTGSDKLVRAQLSALSKREEILLARYKAEQGQGITTNTAIHRRPY